MAEEKKGEKKKVLHHIRTEVVRDHKGKVTGYVSHHAYKNHHSEPHHEPEKPMAVHTTPEEAGEHVQEQMAMAGGGAQPQGGAAGEPDGDEAQAQPQEGAEPQAGM